MCAVFMYVDLFNFFSIAVAGNMIALVDNKGALASLLSKICKSGSEKACSDDEVVKHFTNII